MKVCARVVDFIQIINANGDVRLCSWRRKNLVGNLLKQNIDEIIYGEKAEVIRKTLASGDYSDCDADNCPYIANNKMEDILIDIDEIPKYPSKLYLAYEGVCNYNCTCCTSHQHMEDTRKNDYSKNYDLLEKKINEILPYVNTISANGRGELFASKRTLKLLQSWKPIAPIEEVSVELETNGSMFDEKHWKQIENLGQYNLSVAITIMSFDEKIYQHLSGTKLPISKIEGNLKFVKELREKGVINHLELATVLQEENFREIPEFTRRCIEEFGADIVRIRPIFPAGIYDYNIQWFMDVRNPEHPYYSQYKEIMEHPIFRDPKVLLWSGNIPSSIGKHPGIKAEAIRKALDIILTDFNFIERLEKKTGKNSVQNIYIYGLGTIGKLLIQLYQNKVKIETIIDKYLNLEEYLGIPVKEMKYVSEKIDGVIIVTTYGCFEDIKEELIKNGVSGNIISIYELLDEK